MKDDDDDHDGNDGDYDGNDDVVDDGVRVVIYCDDVS